MAILKRETYLIKQTFTAFKNAIYQEIEEQCEEEQKLMQALKVLHRFKRMRCMRAWQRYTRESKRLNFIGE